MADGIDDNTPLTQSSWTEAGLKVITDGVDDVSLQGQDGAQVYSANAESEALPEETPEMHTEQRLKEQAGHRHWAKVNVRERRKYDGEPGPGLKQHPAAIFQTQLFDGIDPSISPVHLPPDLSEEAARRMAEQEYQKQLRHELNSEHTARLSGAPRLLR